MLGGGGGDVGACASTDVVQTTFLRNPPTLLPRKTPDLPRDGRAATKSDPSMVSSSFVACSAAVIRPNALYEEACHCHFLANKDLNEENPISEEHKGCNPV